MYRLIRKPLLALLKAPIEAPPLPYGTQDALMQSRAARGYLAHQLVSWGLAFFAAIAFAIVALGDFTVNIFGKNVDLIESVYDLPLAVTLVFTSLAFLGKYIAILVDYDVRYYIVTDRNIRIRQGAVILQEATYTFANVQNVKIHQGPLERLFGISTVTIQTAGGGGVSGKEGDFVSMMFAGPGHEGVLRGVSNPVELRDQIQHLVKLHRDSGLGDPDDHSEPPSADEETLLLSIRNELRGVHEALKAGSGS
jgi:membrane protein YdbS with pleckstrin-like domain